MAALRQIVQGLGFADVLTYLQSGNVVFTADTPPDSAASVLETAVERELGLSVRVLVRTRDELADVVERDVLGEIAVDPAHRVVIFLSEAPDPSAWRPSTRSPSSQTSFA